MKKLVYPAFGASCVLIIAWLYGFNFDARGFEAAWVFQFAIAGAALGLWAASND